MWQHARCHTDNSCGLQRTFKPNQFKSDYQLHPVLFQTQTTECPLVEIATSPPPTTFLFSSPIIDQAHFHLWSLNRCATCHWTLQLNCHRKKADKSQKTVYICIHCKYIYAWKAHCVCSKAWNNKTVCIFVDCYLHVVYTLDCTNE